MVLNHEEHEDYQGLRFTFYVLRFTFYVLRFTFYVLRFTFYVLRFTFYVLRFTFYVLRYRVAVRQHIAPPEVLGDRRGVGGDPVAREVLADALHVAQQQLTGVRVQERVHRLRKIND